MPAPTTIVDNVLSIAEMELENISAKDIPNTKREIMEWCAQRGLIKNHMWCPDCNISMSLNSHIGAADGFRWKCNGCFTRKSIRDGSFFSVHRSSIFKVIISMVESGTKLCELRIIGSDALAEITPN